MERESQNDVKDSTGIQYREYVYFRTMNNRDRDEHRMRNDDDDDKKKIDFKTNNDSDNKSMCAASTQIFSCFQPLDCDSINARFSKRMNMCVPSTSVKPIVLL